MSVLVKLFNIKPGQQTPITERELIELVGRRYRKERNGNGTVNSFSCNPSVSHLALYQDVNSNWVAFRYNQHEGVYHVAQKNCVYYDVTITADPNTKTGYSIFIAKYKHI